MPIRGSATPKKHPPPFGVRRAVPLARIGVVSIAGNNTFGDVAGSHQRRGPTCDPISTPMLRRTLLSRRLASDPSKLYLYGWEVL